MSDTVWYTDDGGKSYVPSTAVLPKMDEAQLVQNANGTIIANMRHRSSPTTGRAIATSTDGGTTFSAISYDSTLVASVCQGTIMRSTQNGMVYFANPAIAHGRTHGLVRRSASGASPWTRNRHTLMINRDICIARTGLTGSWDKQAMEVTSTRGAFGYSCLTDVPQSGKIGLLWEGT